MNQKKGTKGTRSEKGALVPQRKWPIAHAMQRARTMPINGLAMGGGAVTFVARKTIYGKMPIKPPHDPVPKNFGQDTGGGDGSAGAIPLDDGFDFDGKIWGLGAIDQNQVRNRSELGQRPGHGLKSGLQNVDLVDDGGRNSASAPGQGACQNFLTKQFASLGG